MADSSFFLFFGFSWTRTFLPASKVGFGEALNSNWKIKCEISYEGESLVIKTRLNFKYSWMLILTYSLKVSNSNSIFSRWFRKDRLRFSRKGNLWISRLTKTVLEKSWEFFNDYFFLLIFVSCYFSFSRVNFYRILNSCKCFYNVDFEFPFFWINRALCCCEFYLSEDLIRSGMYPHRVAFLEFSRSRDLIPSS